MPSSYFYFSLKKKYLKEILMKTTIFNLSYVLSRCSRFIGAMMVAALIMPAVAFSQLSTYANPLVVPLGRAITFGALAYSGITTAGTYTVNGNVGSSTASISTNITAGANRTKYV